MEKPETREETTFIGAKIPTSMFEEIEAIRKDVLNRVGKYPTRSSVIVEALKTGLRAIKEEVE